MKKLIGIVVALVIVLITVIPVSAAQPTDLRLQFGSSRDDTIRGFYTLNDTTLKTSIWEFYNDSDVWAIPYITYHLGSQEKHEVWRYILAPHSSYTMDYVLNFQRTPQNDPDDPNSIRYPAGYEFGMWTGSNPDNYPPY